MTAEVHPLQNLVQQLELYADLPAADRQAVFDLPHRLRRLDPRKFLTREGDLPRTAGILSTGYVIRQKATGESSRQILALCIPGDAVDLPNLFVNASDHALLTLTQAKVVDVPREALQNLVLHRPAIGAAILRLVLVEAAISREWLVNVGRRDARRRIAHILCEFAVRLESRGLAPDDGFELPMSQEQLANATGLTSVHVNRVLKGLEAEGLIDRQRRYIHFDNWPALQEAAGFSRRYLHIVHQHTLAQAD